MVKRPRVLGIPPENCMSHHSNSLTEMLRQPAVQRFAWKNARKGPVVVLQWYIKVMRKFVTFMKHP